MMMIRSSSLCGSYWNSFLTQSWQQIRLPGGTSSTSGSSPTSWVNHYSQLLPAPLVPSLITNVLDTALWFAVPKKKVTRSKKRMKTTRQNRIKIKQNIVVDPRTGETTLQHKLPYNWKDYLPKVE
jgi:ribosomal protein L32